MWSSWSGPQDVMRSPEPPRPRVSQQAGESGGLAAEIRRSDFFTIHRRFSRNFHRFQEKKVGLPHPAAA
jgi:hypothetical protein